MIDLSLYYFGVNSAVNFAFAADNFVFVCLPPCLRLLFNFLVAAFGVAFS